MIKVIIVKSITLWFNCIILPAIVKTKNIHNSEMDLKAVVIWTELKLLRIAATEPQVSKP
jgi:hypothetical protein